MSKLWTTVVTASIGSLVIAWIIILIILYENERHTMPLPLPVPPPKTTGTAGTLLENLITHDHQPQLLPAPEGELHGPATKETKH